MALHRKPQTASPHRLSPGAFEAKVGDGDKLDYPEAVSVGGFDATGIDHRPSTERHQGGIPAMHG